MITDTLKQKACFFFDVVKKEIKKDVTLSVTGKIENTNSTNAFPLLKILGNDNGLFKKVETYLLKYDKYLTKEDFHTRGFLIYKIKSNDEVVNFLKNFGEESVDEENANGSVPIIDPKLRLDSLKSLLKKAGMKFGLHVSDVRFANEELQARFVATIYNCSKNQGDRTMFYLLEAGINTSVNNRKGNVLIVELPNEADYSIFFKEDIGADCFPPKNKIDEERNTKGDTEDNTSENIPKEEKVVDEIKTTTESSILNQTPAPPIPEIPVAPEPIVIASNSPYMQMARLAYENLSGAEKVAFLHEYGKSLIPDEEEIVNRRKPQWEKDYALTFENKLRNTMKDEIHDDVTAEVTELLTPKLKNIVRPEVLDTAKKLAFNEMKELLVLKFKGKYSIVPSDGVWKIFTGHNGKITIETVSIDDLLKQVKS